MVSIAILLLCFSAILWVSNYTILSYFLKRNYTYSNYNATFLYEELRLQGRPYEGRDRRYQSFLEQHPNVKDKQLYRTFSLDPWRFWEWHEWVNHFERFKLPYISEKEIQQNREKESLDSALN